MTPQELNATVEDGTIRNLPPELNGKTVRITVLEDQPDATLPVRNFNLERARAAWAAVAKVNPFREIEDPVAWQRQLRDEWE